MMPLAMAGVMVAVACAVWLLTRIVDHTVALQTRRRYEAVERLRLKLNQQRAARGLDPFPELPEIEAVAEERARVVHPEGFRDPDAMSEPGARPPITYGVFVVPETIRHPAAREAPLVAEFTDVRRSYFAGIADEYARRGRKTDADTAIVIYYASLMLVYPFLTRQQTMATVSEIVDHELEHLTDVETRVDYGKSLARRDDLHNFWARRRRRRHQAR